MDYYKQMEEFEYEKRRRWDAVLWPAYKRQAELSQQLFEAYDKSQGRLSRELFKVYNQR